MYHLTTAAVAMAGHVHVPAQHAGTFTESQRIISGLVLATAVAGILFLINKIRFGRFIVTDDDIQAARTERDARPGTVQDFEDQPAGRW